MTEAVRTTHYIKHHQTYKLMGGHGPPLSTDQVCKEPQAMLKYPLQEEGQTLSGFSTYCHISLWLWMVETTWLSIAWPK